MKKILLLIAMFTVGLTLTACNLVGDVNVDPECTSLQELVDGKCTDIVVDECPVGEVKDANGDCVPEVVDVTCATGEEKVNDECVPVCGTDQTRINGVCTDNPPVLDSLVLSGIADLEVNAGFVVFLLDGVKALGSDNVNYTSAITLNSDDCTITANKTVRKDTPGSCIVTYSAVVAGKLARMQRTIVWKAEAVDSVPEDAPVIKEWNFDTDADLVGWGKYADGGGAVTESVADGALVLDVTNSTNVYGARLDYVLLPFEIGEKYTVTFKAKASVDFKVISVQMGNFLPSADNAYFTDFKPGYVEHFELNQTWQDYEFTFVHTPDASTKTTGGILFEMGNIPADAVHDHLESLGIDAIIYLDDIKIRGGSGEDKIAPVISGADYTLLATGTTFDAMVGVKAEDFVDGDVTANVTVSGTVDVNTAGEYTLTYSVSDTAGNVQTATRLVKVTGLVADANNSTVVDWSTDATLTGTEGMGWYNSQWGDADFTAEFVSGKLVMSLEKTFNDDGTPKDWGTNPWDAISRYFGVTFLEGVDYRITFDAMTGVAAGSKMMFKVEDTDKGFGTDRMFDLTTTMQTFTFDFKFDKETSSTGSVLFFIGGTEHVVTIENLVILISDEGANTVNAPKITADDLTVDQGKTFDALENVSVFDVEDSDIVPTFTIVGPNGETVFDSNILGDWVLTYTAIDSDSNETVLDITISVVVPVAALVTGFDLDLLFLDNWVTWGDNSTWTADGTLSVVTPAGGDWSSGSKISTIGDGKLAADSLTFEANYEYEMTIVYEGTEASSFFAKLLIGANETYENVVISGAGEQVYKTSVRLTSAETNGEIAFNTGATAGTLTIKSITFTKVAVPNTGFDLTFANLDNWVTWGDNSTWTADGTLSVVTPAGGDWSSGSKISTIGDGKLAADSLTFEANYEYEMTIVYEGTEASSFFAKLLIGTNESYESVAISGAGEQVYIAKVIATADATNGEIAFNTGVTAGTLTIKSITFTKVEVPATGLDLAFANLDNWVTWGDNSTWTADGTLSVVTPAGGDWSSGSKISTIGDGKLAADSLSFDANYQYEMTIVYEGTEASSFYAKLLIGANESYESVAISGTGEQVYTTSVIVTADATNGEIAFNTGVTAGTLTIKSITFTRVLVTLKQASVADTGLDLTFTNLDNWVTWGDNSTWTADGTLSVVTPAGGDWSSGSKISTIGDGKLAADSLTFEANYEYVMRIVYEGTEASSFFAKLLIGTNESYESVAISGAGEQVYIAKVIATADATNGEIAFNTGVTAGTLTIKSIIITRVSVTVDDTVVVD